MSWAPALFGDVLLSEDGAEVKTEEALADKVVGIYFSAHWCPPCRGFTPEFARIYGELKSAGKNFEVVFASSDRDESSFDEYRSEMPWLSLPYANRAAKSALSSKYKVSGIPTLVILDEKGEVITKEGRGAVMNPENFPWIPPTLLDALGGESGEFLTGDGEKKTLKELTDAGKHIGVYFSAHWCGPCRNFTPKLAAAYEKVNEDGSGAPLEILFVSADNSESEFDEYRSAMPWLSVPLSDKKRIAALNGYFNTEGIPHLAILGPDLKLINKDARGAVMSDKNVEHFPWHPKLVTDVDEALDEGINDTPTILALMEEAGDAWDGVGAALTAVATRVRAAEKERGEEDRSQLFMTVTESGGGIGAQIRKMAKLGKAGPKAQMVLLDIAEGGFVKHEGAVDEAAIETLANDYKQGKLELVKFE